MKAVAVEAYVSGLSLECVRKLLEEMEYSVGSARLAHHLFHRNTEVNYFLDERGNRFNHWKQRRQEKEAEVFAAYLLIPEEKLNALLKQDWVKSLQTNSRTSRGILSFASFHEKETRML